MTQITQSLSISNKFKVPLVWQGVLWKLLSFAAFAATNGVVRYLSGGGSVAPDAILPTHVIQFFQNVFGTLLLLPLLWPAGIRSLKTHYLGLHSVRVMTAVMGISLWYLSLKYLPIAEGLALTFTGPVFTVIGAYWMLGEKLTLQRFMAITLSIVGAYIISRPDLAFSGKENAGLGLAALLPLASALALAFSKLFTRKLANLGESPQSLATYLLLLMTPVSLVPALFEWTWPNAEHWHWLLLLGFFAAVAHWSFAKAYALAEVTFLTPFGFSKFLFSTFIGFYFFAEIPSKALWIGLMVIGASIVLLIYKIPLYSTAKRLRSS